MRAIRYIGMSGAADAQQQLMNVYSASNDAAVKREIIRSLMASKGRDALFNLAKNEKDAGLRGRRSGNWELFGRTTSLGSCMRQSRRLRIKWRSSGR